MLTEGEAGEGEKTKQESSPTQANKSLREQAKFKVQRQRQTYKNPQGVKLGKRLEQDTTTNRQRMRGRHI